MNGPQKNAVFVAKTWKPPEGWSSVYLRPGEYIVSDGSPLLVSTVLGSCVSVTMFVPALGLGAITHGVLPRSCGRYAKVAQGTGRFVDTSIHAVVQELRGLGIRPSQTEVKVFGGSQMYGQWGDASGLRIGWENVEAALDTLSDLGYTVLATDVGGNRGRKLLFVSHTGEVWVKRLSRPVQSDEVKHEPIPD